jgi:hypothetical protein
MPKIKITDKDGNVVYPTTPVRYNSMTDGDWTLAAGEKESHIWDQLTISSDELAPGEYTITTDSALPDDLESESIFYISGMGYVLLISGDNADDLKDIIDEASNRIYSDLLSMGYGPERILHLNRNEYSGVDATASSQTVEDAIKYWASIRVSESEPLFLVMFDHGGVDNFCVDSFLFDDNVDAADLDSWLDTLQAGSGADVYTYYMACHSGSFIDDLTGDGRITITSSRSEEDSLPSVAPYWEFMTQVYWPLIKSGSSLGAAFNAGTYQVAEIDEQYHPILDDNGDGVGHGWDTPTGWGYLPHHGDGGAAFDVHMGGDWLELPSFGSLIEKRPYMWPIPPDPTPIWTTISTPTPLARVEATALFPGIEEFAFNTTNLEKFPVETFEMTDDDKDGVWTADIPAQIYEKYLDGPDDITIIVNAEDENGEQAVPMVTSVEFSRNGLLTPDTRAPGIRLDSPRQLDIVSGTTTISGMAMDDQCVQKAELYMGNFKLDTKTLPRSSNSEFGFQLDTLDLPEGFHDLTINIFDASGNSVSQTITVT